MNPIPITPADLAVLLFGPTVERNKHIDEAAFHWLRRPGAPAMDMPHKIISPHLAAEILKADPDGAFLYIQTVTATDLTYHVLWETRHWLESNERILQRFHTARAHREAFFTAKSRDLAEADAHSRRLAHMISCIHACGVSRTRATAFVEQAWKDAADEDTFKARIQSIENLFNITGIYQPPYEHQDHEDQDDIIPAQANGQANQEQADEAGQTPALLGDEDRCVGNEDRGPARGASGLVESPGTTDSGTGCADSSAPSERTDGTHAQGCEVI